MPIAEVRALPQVPPVDVPAVLGRVCTDLAEAIGATSPRQVWATWQTLPDGHYVEGPDDAERQPRETHPPLVRILALEGRDARTVRTMLRTVAETLGRELDVEPDNVFVRYEEMASGTVLTGGDIP